jgi:hypothetical protein
MKELCIVCKTDPCIKGHTLIDSYAASQGWESVPRYVLKTTEKGKPTAHSKPFIQIGDK